MIPTEVVVEACIVDPDGHLIHSQVAPQQSKEAILSLWGVGSVPS